MNFIFYIALALFVFLSFLLTVVVLVQESKSMGLGASFGGDPGESLFGTGTADVLKKLTTYLATIFMISCLLLSLWTSSIGRSQSPIQINIEETEP